MLSSLTEFLQDRTMVASITYSFLFIFYYGYLVALSIMLAVSFPLRGRIIAGLIVLYTFANLGGEGLSESVSKARMATNASSLRLFLVMIVLGLLFSILLEAPKKAGGRKN